jgi:hypothetical protein
MTETFINATITVIGQNGITVSGTRLIHRARPTRQISRDKTISPVKTSQPIAKVVTQIAPLHQGNKPIAKGVMQIAPLRQELLGINLHPGTLEVRGKRQEAQIGPDNPLTT